MSCRILYTRRTVAIFSSSDISALHLNKYLSLTLQNVGPQLSLKSFLSCYIPFQDGNCRYASATSKKLRDSFHQDVLPPSATLMAVIRRSSVMAVNAFVLAVMGWTQALMKLCCLKLQAVHLYVVRNCSYLSVIDYWS